jgi:hypothetical protein
MDTTDQDPQPEGEPDAPMDTGAPPGVHPNSDVPDPEVVEESERRAGREEDLHEDYGPGEPPSGPDPVENPAGEDAATAD